VRETALAYFTRHRIKWWTSRWDVGRPKLQGVGLPTGHLNSSQVACVNHLEPARVDRELARRVARNVGVTFVDVQPVEDGGFVAYEWIGKDNYLDEPGARVRGANITSLDGLMYAERGDGTRVLIVIEWKYLESYARNRWRRRAVAPTASRPTNGCLTSPAARLSVATASASSSSRTTS
jgi:hypothetical protein